jgi:hypothetical protein
MPLGLTGATAATRYVGATAAGAPAAGTFAVGDFVIDQSGALYVCTVAGSPGMWVQIGGGSSALAVIENQTLAADAASFDFQAIPQTYRHLRIIFMGRGANASLQVEVAMRFNADAGANYDNEAQWGDSNANTAAGSVAATYLRAGTIPAANATASRAGGGEILIPSYAGATFHKRYKSIYGHTEGTAATDQETGHASGGWRSTSAITRVQLLPSVGNWLAGSQATLYGVS